ncbi:hypothetical protein ABT168_02840 [Streptomyces sp. NPDC001793]|uniref:hypothetical protein n=1 Tax=Streptomyces sp. NPDC001793 TaxID=3154657 RepID=UPI003327F46E
MPCGRSQNNTPPVEDTVLQPMLAAALYLVSALGPHAVELAEEVRESDRALSCKAKGLRPAGSAPVVEWTGSYAHLRVEFERWVQALQDAGEIPNPREDRIARLKEEITKLRERLARSEQEVDELTDFRGQALARLAAQHEEIVRLRESVAGTSRVSRPPAPRTTVIGSGS